MPVIQIDPQASIQIYFEVNNGGPQRPYQKVVRGWVYGVEILHANRYILVFFGIFCVSQRCRTKFFRSEKILLPQYFLLGASPHAPGSMPLSWPSLSANCTTCGMSTLIRTWIFETPTSKITILCSSHLPQFLRIIKGTLIIFSKVRNLSFPEIVTCDWTVSSNAIKLLIIRTWTLKPRHLIETRRLLETRTAAFNRDPAFIGDLASIRTLASSPRRLLMLLVRMFPVCVNFTLRVNCQHFISAWSTKQPGNYLFQHQVLG